MRGRPKNGQNFGWGKNSRFWASSSAKKVPLTAEKVEIGPQMAKIQYGEKPDIFEYAGAGKDKSMAHGVTPLSLVAFNGQLAVVHYLSDAGAESDPSSSLSLMLHQLFGVGALAHRGLPPVRGFVREVPQAFPAPHHSAREGCPGHCGTLFYGQISSR